MEKQDKYIELLPSNWLYNAGVVGFLSVLEKSNFEVKKLFQNDGTIRGDISKVFNEKRPHENFEVPEIIWNWFIASGKNLKKNFDENGIDPIRDIWGTIFNVLYRGFFNANSNLLYQPSQTTPATFSTFLNFTNNLFEYDENNPTCSFCLKKGRQSYKNKFSSEHYRELGGSDGDKGMPNSFWNNKKSIGGIVLCDSCCFLLLNRHLAFTSLNDWTKIFINAPSFKLMYELNKIVNSSFEWSNDNSNRSLLAMSVIEYCAKADAALGVWSGMNIEIVAVTKKLKENGQYDDVIEYYSLPSSVIRLISNKRIASLLSEIGEFKILNLVLDEKFKELVEISYRILKISMKEDENKGDKKFLDDALFLKKNKYNKNVQRLVANKIMKLYALIEEQLKTE
jgi:CRISPR-associated protein Cst1